MTKPPEQIIVGHVIRATETHYNLFECFDPETNTCKLNQFCLLKGLMSRALRAFFDELDKYSLADLIKNKSAIKKALAKE